MFKHSHSSCVLCAQFGDLSHEAMVRSNGRGEGLKVTHSLKVSAIIFVVGNFVLNTVTAIFEDLTHKVQDGRHAVGG